MQDLFESDLNRLAVCENVPGLRGYGKLLGELDPFSLQR